MGIYYFMDKLGMVFHGAKIRFFWEIKNHILFDFYLSWNKNKLIYGIRLTDFINENRN